MVTRRVHKGQMLLIEDDYARQVIEYTLGYCMQKASTSFAINPVPKLARLVLRLRKQSGRLHHVLHEAGNRHGADAARHGGDGRGYG